MTKLCTMLETHKEHRDPSRPSPVFTKKFRSADGFVIERDESGAFRITHAKAPYVLGIGSSEALEWHEEAFLPALAAATEKPRREKVS